MAGSGGTARCVEREGGHENEREKDGRKGVRAEKMSGKVIQRNKD